MAGLNPFATLCLASLITRSACAPTPAQSNQTLQLQYVTLEEHYGSDIVVPYQTDPVIEVAGEALENSAFSLVQNINRSRLDSRTPMGYVSKYFSLGSAVKMHCFTELMLLKRRSSQPILLRKLSTNPTS